MAIAIQPTASLTAKDRSNARFPLRGRAALEKKALWLSTYLIHNANNLRISRDGQKVGAHQSSSASVATLMTALYFYALRPQDRIAVKPHASPVMHAIQYMMGRQSLDQLERFRALGGAQSYPSRTKDKVEVDFSTGSVGLGVAATLFAALVQDYVSLNGFTAEGASSDGRMIALLGDAELDEGDIYEALLEGWKHEVKNLWWIIDYNRQSLDGVVNDALFSRIDGFFRAVDWKGHRHRRTSGQPFMARRRSPKRHHATGRHPLRPVGRPCGPLPRAPRRRGRHGRGGAGLAALRRRNRHGSWIGSLARPLAAQQLVCRRLVAGSG